MKRNWLYRIGAGLLAGILVFTGVPQISSRAEEEDIAMAQQLEEERETSDTDDADDDAYIEDEKGTDDSDGVKDEGNGSDESKNADTDHDDSIEVPDDTDGKTASTAGKDDADKDKETSEEDSLLEDEDASDTDIEDEMIETTPTKRKKAARVIEEVQENADEINETEITPYVDSTGGSVKIDTSGDGWSAGDSEVVGAFSLQRSSATSVEYDENKRKIKAIITLPSGGDILQAENELSGLHVEWKVEGSHVEIANESRDGNEISAEVKAKSDAIDWNNGPVTDVITVSVTGSVTRTITNASGASEDKTVEINCESKCRVNITKLLLRKIELDSRLTVPGGVTDLKANGTPGEYAVTFVPADADNIGGAQPLYTLDTDKSHVESELIAPDPITSGGWKIKLQAKNVGNATIYIRAADIESERFTVSVSQFEPVELTGFELRVKSSTGSWAAISDPYEMKEKTNMPVRVYFEPSNTTERDVAVTADSNLLEVTEATVGEGYKEYRINARELTSADSLVNNCATATLTVAPQNTSVASKSYTINIRKETHPVSAIAAWPETLELKDRGAGNEGSFRISITPYNADHKGIKLTADHPILIRKRGETSYTEISSTQSLTVEATDISSGGQDAVCDFEVQATRDETGDFVITAESDDPAFSGNAQIAVKVTHHKIEGITMSPTTLELQESPETGYEQGDLGEIEAQIDPTEAHNRKIIWEVTNASGSTSADPAVRIVKETDQAQVTTIETEADEDSGKSKIKLIGLKRGECIITAKSAETESVKAQCRVKVTAGRYSVESIDLLDGEGETIRLDRIVMRPNTRLDLRAKVNPQTAINADLTISNTGDGLSTSTGSTTDGITQIYISSLANENGEGDTVTLRAGDREKTIEVLIRNPYMEFAQKELHYAPDEVSEEAIRRDLHVNFYPIISPDPESFERVTNYKLTLVAESGALLTPESANWAEELAKPGEKKLRVKYIYTEGSTDFPFEEELPLVISQYPLVDLVQVINPDKVWNVSNGISLSSISLPTKVDITVRDREADSSENNRRMRADVSWDRRSDRYDPNSKEEQNFTLNGMVTLPEGVRNPNGASLAVQVEVNVREAMEGARTVKTPAASVENGATLTAGAEITLTCETEGALIYYTLDGREATRNGRLYTAPIKLTAKTTVLRAMAYKEGWKDSAPMKIVVYLDGAAVGPTDPDDPNDPDVPTPDDVTPDDKEQIDGKTDGLWAVIQGAEDRDGKVAVFAYTGNAYKPVVHVYDGTKLLKEKRDYTVSYKNNKNAGGPGISENYPAVIITGKGNYEGKVEVPFIIKPQSIEDDSVMMDDFMAVTYNKKAQKPSPKLTWNGKKLVNKKDFTFPEESYKMPGVYTVQVTGIGNFTGTRLFTYEIYETGVSAAKFTVSKIPDQKYTGKRITPEITVKYNGVKLFPNANYEIRYENNLNVGTASVLIVGKGGYKGSKRISFKILPIADMKNVAVAMTFSPSNPVYEGKPVKPASYTLVYHAKELKEGEDYTVSYQNNDKAGKATAIFTGKGAYKGSVKKTFRIGAGSILKATVEMDLSYPYQKGGCKPQPKVVVGDRVLEAGTDYTLSYKNNNKIGNTAQVIIKGKGNYTGSMPKFFAITVQDISNLTVLADDKAYSKGKNAYKTKVQVLDVNGKALKAGTDYAKDVIYTYATGEKKDQPVLPSDVLPVGTRIQVEVRVTQPKLYQGKAYGSFRIVQANIKDAKVKVMDQEYTGKKVKPNKSQIISITLKGVPLTENDYEIISYQNNIERGKAKMTIRGIGDYGGTKVVTFKIKKKGILDLKH